MYFRNFLNVKHLRCLILTWHSLSHDHHTSFGLFVEVEKVSDPGNLVLRNYFGTQFLQKISQNFFEVV